MNLYMDIQKARVSLHEFFFVGCSNGITNGSIA